ncbi:MAG: extracellular solute-binding protein [Burkholderiales bacterium]|nr:extracellular solute-binding protein [Burkholderiales bacterium]
MNTRPRHLTTLARAALFAACLASSCLAFADKQRIEFWTQSLSPKFDDYFRNLVTRYNAAHPDVDVVWVDYPWDVIRTKFTVAIASGHPPALVNMNVPWANDYKQLRLIQPVDKWIDKSQYLPNSVEDLTFDDGHVYAFPFYTGAHVIAYNTTLFKAAGLDPKRAPTSLDEVLAFSKQIKAKTGAAGFGPALGPTKIEGLMMEEGLPIMQNGRAVFNSPAHVAFVNKLADAYRAGALLKDNLFGQDNFQVSMGAYNSGRLAILRTVPSSLIRVRDDAPDIYKVTEVAGAPLGPTKIAPGGWQFNYVVARNVDPKLLPAIGQFGNYLTNAENQLVFSKLAGTLPTAKQTAADPYFHDVPAGGSLIERGVVAAAHNLDYTHTLFLANVRDPEMLSTKLSSAVEQAVTGRRDAKAALDDAVQFWNQKLARR